MDWPALARTLDDNGSAVMPSILSPAECESIAATFDTEQHFRSRIVMERQGFGRGEYKYFAYPLPVVIASLRAALYPRLAPIANRWNEALRIGVRYPPEHAEFLDRCHRAGQTRPTPLLFRYGAGDYNRMHQDLYGEHLFPLQVLFMLSVPGRDFSGGEFVLTEQRPRMQSRAEVVSFGQGDAVIFAVRERPLAGTRGSYRVVMRHGVSRVRTGRRYTMGIIFHDAR
ncbi:MAG TPA: 2OG-Fe(II) oxygenase [Candidatus Binataceae bacterium]|nr:2OG-Fe(II) oxygenase [Candidatus Binataceae bacterium]